MDHSFEEIRSIAIDILAGRESVSYEISQYQNLLIGVAEVMQRREGMTPSNTTTALQAMNAYGPSLSRNDQDLFLEVFWSLFREGVITLGLNDANRQFPFFRTTQFGSKLLQNPHTYFFHDVSSYERAIKEAIPAMNPVTLLYLKEAMQAFKAGALLAATVMLGVATEHTFLLLIETIERSPTYSVVFKNVSNERTILAKINKFKGILDNHASLLPSPLQEDIDTHFAGILAVIRNFRNRSGHPTGKIVDREQAYVLLQLFITYGKKMYSLIDHFQLA